MNKYNQDNKQFSQQTDKINQSSKVDQQKNTSFDKSKAGQSNTGSGSSRQTVEQSKLGQQSDRLSNQTDKSSINQSGRSSYGYQADAEKLSDQSSIKKSSKMDDSVAPSKRVADDIDSQEEGVDSERGRHIAEEDTEFNRFNPQAGKKPLDSMNSKITDIKASRDSKLDKPTSADSTSKK